MSLVQSIYFSKLPAHKQPQRKPVPGASNRALRGSDKYHGPKYAVSKDVTTLGRKMLNALQKARDAGSIVRLLGDTWHINGRPMAY